MSLDHLVLSDIRSKKERERGRKEKMEESRKEKKERKKFYNDNGMLKGHKSQ